MADKPIIFSASMINALMSGRKTQTRRVLKQQPRVRPEMVEPPSGDGPTYWAIFDGDLEAGKVRVPYAIGDRLWVREAVTWVSAWGWRYRADNDDLTEKRESGEVEKWKPSIHMPRIASRLTLTVTNVRVQRLQEISPSDCLEEGWPGAEASGGLGGYRWYSHLWNSLHGPDAWDENPWVVALTFTVASGNIDTLGADNA